MVYSEEASFLKLRNIVLSCLHFQGGFDKVPRGLYKMRSIAYRPIDAQNS